MTQTKETLKEGKAIIFENTAEVVSKQLEVFYNPVMKFNRDTSIEFIKNYFHKPIKAALPLSGSGVRGVRMLLNNEYEKLLFNDLNPKAIERIKQNLDSNKEEIEKMQNKSLNEAIELHQDDANLFLRKNGMFDYIDIDPFGSSIPFIESAVTHIKKNGILAITNTDTAALCGSYPRVTQRRYGSIPFNHEIRQQFGLRILIKKVQEIAAMHDKTLIPVFAFSKDHYMRAYLKVSNKKQDCEKILNQHEYLEVDKNRLLNPTDKAKGKNIVGKLYTGPLYDKELTLKMNIDSKFFDRIQNDAELDNIFYFYDIHEICKMNSWPVPNYEKIENEIVKQNAEYGRSHFLPTAILTDLEKTKVIKILNKLAKEHK